MKDENFRVSNIRFISMIGIVAVHSYIFNPGRENSYDDILRLMGIQFFKFGTLCFFMISGFLIGDKLNKYSPSEFFTRRLRAVGVPWAFWASVFLAMICVNAYFKGTFEFLNLVLEVLFRSEYWFVPNFMLALGVLVVFGKYIQSAFLGLFLLCLSLFYSLNIYWKILPSEHTMSLFGYVFYLWLGMHVAIERLGWIRIIKDLSVVNLILISGLSYILALAESYFVSRFGQSEALNTLRISNQIYGISIFFILLKIHKPIFPSFTNPVKDTFGIYLIQWIIIYLYSAVASRLIPVYLKINRGVFLEQYLDLIPWYIRIIWWIMSFVLIYMLSLMATQFIYRSRFKRLVGK